MPKKTTTKSKLLKKTLALTSASAMVLSLTGTATASSLFNSTATPSQSSWNQFKTSCSNNVLACGTQQAQSGQVIPKIPFGPATTYQRYAKFFPSSWNQLQYNQSHNPVFSVPKNAPSFLTHGTSWASPITGDEFLRLARGFSRYGINGGENWGSESAQWLGNVTGVSVVDGIVYAEESNNEVVALDAATGLPIWKAKTVNSAMGQPLVENINGKPIIFVSAGDVGFTVKNALNFANQVSPSQPATRGANFSAVYAINGLTGKKIWRFDTKGNAMPTPVYHNGSLFFNTGGGHLYALNASTGTLQSSLLNPNPSFSSMSSANFYTTPSGAFYVIYGTQSANIGTSSGDNLIAVNETNPLNPIRAWSYNVVQGVNTGLGDVPPVVDQKLGLVLTDVLVNQGTPAKPLLNIQVIAVNANTGTLSWSHHAGSGPSGFVPYSFKGSVPMIHGNNLYLGDLLNQTYQSYNVTTGVKRWTTPLSSSRDISGTVHQPRGGAVYWKGKIIEAEGINIFTISAKTGKILNNFMDPGYFGVWGITTPVIVGNEMYLGSISGWIFAVPVNFVTTNPGTGPGPGVRSALSGQGNVSVAASAVVPPNPPSYFNPAALPTNLQKEGSPNQNTSENQHHNDVTKANARPTSWQTALHHSLALSAPARDSAILGTQTAIEKTSLAFGAGSGITPSNGIVYIGSERYRVNAINAITGQKIWSFKTVNANYGHPIVTPKAVIVSSGDPWFNFTGLVHITKGIHAHVGASFQNLHGLNPITGKEMWTFYTAGSNMTTPLYNKGNLYWLNGNGNVWGINATTGKPIAPFENPQGNPTLSLPGFNATASAHIARANVVYTSHGDIMVVGTADPTAFYAINLSTDTVVWKTTSLPVGLTPYFTGFSAASPAVDQAKKLIITSVLVNANTATNTVTDEAVAMNTNTGAVVWTQTIGKGPIPYGYTSAAPFIHKGVVYFADPVSSKEVALSLPRGNIKWSTSLKERTKAVGVAVNGKIIQAAGPDIFTLNSKTGAIINTTFVGGYFKNQAPAVMGRTLYIGNSWGWAMAFPINQLQAAPSNSSSKNSLHKQDRRKYIHGS